jgi:hypothetical protein
MLHMRNLPAPDVDEEGNEDEGSKQHKSLGLEHKPMKFGF